MAAAAMASVTVTAALPGVSCALTSSRDSAVNMSASANFVGIRVDTAAAARPGFSRSSRSLVVRAEDKPSLWESITSLFGAAKKKATEVAAQGEKELNKAASKAKSASEDLGDKSEKFKDEAQVQAEEAAEEVKGSVEDVKEKVEEAVEATTK